MCEKIFFPETTVSRANKAFHLARGTKFETSRETKRLEGVSTIGEHCSGGRQCRWAVKIAPRIYFFSFITHLGVNDYENSSSPSFSIISERYRLSGVNQVGVSEFNKHKQLKRRRWLSFHGGEKSILESARETD